MTDTVKITQKEYDLIRERVNEVEFAKPFRYGDEKFDTPIDMALTNFWLDIIELNYVAHYKFNLDTNELVCKFYNKTTNKSATTKHKDFTIGWNGSKFFENIDQYFSEDSDVEVKKYLSIIIGEFPKTSPAPLRGRKITIYSQFILMLEIICKSFLCLPSVWKKETLAIKGNQTTMEEKLVKAVFGKREVRMRNVYVIKSGINLKKVMPSKHLSCPCWAVRGHYRHLANGKVVFVKPYTKGTQRKNKALQVSKDYVS